MVELSRLRSQTIDAPTSLTSACSSLKSSSGSPSLKLSNSLQTAINWRLIAGNAVAGVPGSSNAACNRSRLCRSTSSSLPSIIRSNSRPVNGADFDMAFFVFVRLSDRSGFGVSVVFLRCLYASLRHVPPGQYMQRTVTFTGNGFPQYAQHLTVMITVTSH